MDIHVTSSREVAVTSPGIVWALNGHRRGSISGVSFLHPYLGVIFLHPCLGVILRVCPPSNEHSAVDVIEVWVPWSRLRGASTPSAS